MYERIRALREDKDLTQRQIGQALNISTRCYSYYEAGQRMIPPYVLRSLAVFHNVSTDYILELTDVATPVWKKYPARRYSTRKKAKKSIQKQIS